MRTWLQRVRLEPDGNRTNLSQGRALASASSRFGAQLMPPVRGSLSFSLEGLTVSLRAERAALIRSQTLSPEAGAGDPEASGAGVSVCNFPSISNLSLFTEEPTGAQRADFPKGIARGSVDIQTQGSLTPSPRCPL